MAMIAIQATYSYFDSFAELLTPPTAMLATREARGTASRTALRWAINGTNDVENQCDPRAKQGIRDIGQAILCDKYGGRWIEVNLAGAFWQEMLGGTHERYKCTGFENGRPPLGWTLSGASADVMDCFLREKKFFGDVFERATVILSAQRRTAMNETAYHLIEGWQRTHLCAVDRGRWIIRGQPLEEKPAIDKCYEVPPEVRVPGSTDQHWQLNDKK
jgi:hypothetical protein